MKQVTAARRFVRSIEALPEHSALKEMVLGLAEAVDKDPKNAALWREYRQAETELREATTNSDDDESQAILVSFKTPRVQPQVGNP